MGALGGGSQEPLGPPEGWEGPLRNGMGPRAFLEAVWEGMAPGSAPGFFSF